MSGREEEGSRGPRGMGWECGCKCRGKEGREGQGRGEQGAGSLMGRREGAGRGN